MISSETPSATTYSRGAVWDDAVLAPMVSEDSDIGRASSPAMVILGPMPAPVAPVADYVRTNDRSKTTIF